MNNPKVSKECLLIRPKENNPRNSEGDFIKLSDGSIMFAYTRYSGTSCSDDAYAQIAAVYSDDNGETWTTEPEILVTPDETKNEINVMSVSFMRMLGGDVGLFYIIKYNDATIKYVLRRSTDEGKTFSEPFVCIGEIFKGYYVVNNNRVLRTRTNRLIIPTALHRTYVDENGENGHFDSKGTVYFFVSDDDGYTWEESKGVLTFTSAHCRSGLQEPGVLELENGTLYAYMRTDMGRHYESVSIDNGETWFPVQPSQFMAPNSPMKIAKNPYSGKFYSVWNNADFHKMQDRKVDIRKSWERSPLTIAQSDDGIHFSNALIIDDDEYRGFSYPAIHFIDEKTILLGYCSGGIEDGSNLNRITIRKLVL